MQQLVLCLTRVQKQSLRCKSLRVLLFGRLQAASSAVGGSRRPVEQHQGHHSVHVGQPRDGAIG